MTYRQVNIDTDGHDKIAPLKRDPTIHDIIIRDDATNEHIHDNRKDDDWQVIYGQKNRGNH